MSEKSAAEIEIMRVWNDLMSYGFISVHDFKKFLSRLSSLLFKCEELRKSRDKWRARAENAEKELKKSSSG